VSSLTRSIDPRASVQVRGSKARLVDVMGAALFLSAAAWTIWASVRAGGSAAPMVGLLLACGLVLMVARSIASHARFIVPLAALLAAVIVVARSRTGVLSRAPLSGPFEYINADAAFYVQAAIAGLMVASSARPWTFRVLGGLGAAFFAALPFIVHAAAAATLVVLLPAITFGSVVLAGARTIRLSVALLGALFVGVLTASIVLGATYSPGTQPSGLQRAAFSTIDRERVALWHDALLVMREHPWTGVGPGRYQEVSPIASRDRDSRWAHNEFLQQGAEGGVTGLVLLAALFGWGFARLWSVKRPDVVTALSAASLAALGIHTCVDYVLHFPAIPLITAGLVAAGMIDRGEKTSEPGQALERDDLTQARSRS